jgi:hypothetical protein
VYSSDTTEDCDSDGRRVTSDADINLAINPATGVVTTETPLNPGNPSITAAA